MTLKKGLKEFKEVLKHHTIEEIIEEGIRITLAFPNTWSPNTEWSNFMWGFGNAWMNFYKTIIGNKKDVAATFPIGDVLTSDQLKYIAQKVGIVEEYKKEIYK